jgi:NADPH2:quinone reductase
VSDYRIVFRKTGGPDVLEREDLTALTPAAGEAIVRHEAVGLNFIDTYYRAGLYKVDLPSGLGGEAAGMIEAVGEGVTAVKPGDRVAYAGGPLGGYSSLRAMPADLLIKLPDDIDAETAAAVMLKGLTADMLIGECGKVLPGQTILVHAAAGGVGSLLVPWIKAMGAKVIAHAGSADKAAKAKALGADEALFCPFEELADRVKALTAGKGVDTVLDGVGKASWDASIASLRSRGLMVSYGNASGAVPAVEPLALSRAGSLFLTRPTLFHYIATAPERDAAAGRLFAMLENGTLKVEIGQTFALDHAADAHRALESRQTTGSTVLIP